MSSDGVCLLGRRDPRRCEVDPLLQVAQLTAEQVERRALRFRHVTRSLEQPVQVVDAPRVVPKARLRRDDPELRQMRADRLHRLGPLAQEEVPRIAIEQCRLPLILARNIRDYLRRQSQTHAQPDHDRERHRSRTRGLDLSR